MTTYASAVLAVPCAAYRGSTPSRSIRKAVLAIALSGMSFVQGTVVASDTVKVFKNSGALQCQAVGVSVDDMAGDLRRNGVKVLSSSCATDGRLRIAMCGADAGVFYVYEIEVRDRPKAMDLGFGEIDLLRGYREVSCPAPKPAVTPDAQERRESGR